MNLFIRPAVFTALFLILAGCGPTEQDMEIELENETSADLDTPDASGRSYAFKGAQWPNKFLAIVIYKKKDFREKHTSIWLDKADTNKDISFRIDNNVESFVMKPHCRAEFNDWGAIHSKEYASHSDPGYHDSPSKHGQTWDYVAINCEHDSQPRALLYQESNFGGDSLPIWGSLTLPAKFWNGAIRSVQMDPGSSQMLLGRDGPTQVMGIVRARTEIASLSSSTWGLVDRIELANYACYPARTCFEGPQCNFGDEMSGGFYATSSKCESAGGRSWCTDDNSQCLALDPPYAD